MNLREKALNELAASSSSNKWEGCYESCFRVLYGLPAKLQLNSSLSMLRRYLPIFETNRPKVRWARKLLDAPDQWFQKKGDAFPTPRDVGRLGDSAFIL